MRAPLINLKGFAAELRASIDSLHSQLSDLPGLQEQQTAIINGAIQQDIPEALHFIDSAVTRMDHLTNAILRLSRLGRRVLDFEPINMNALVETILDSLAHQIKEQQAKVETARLPDVKADRTAMEQIMGNILTNAVFYLSPDRPGEISVTSERNHKEVIYHIRDNGRGIADEDRAKVFEPFRRAGKQDVPGEGMGLAYVQVLIRRHGGRIWFVSKVGVGTTFSFAIPLNPGANISE